MRRLSVPVLVLAVLLLGSCASEDAPAEAPAESRAPGRGRASASSIDTDLDLKGMLPPVPAYEGQGRNLFAYGPARRTMPVQPTRPTPTPRARVTTTVPRPAPTPAAARVNVKYAGFVEKTEASGDKAKYAIFLDGNEIFAGAEGETIANRFTVVEIGLESVTVSAEGSSATQRIPLQAN